MSLITVLICSFVLLPIPLGYLWIWIYRHRKDLGLPDWLSGILAQGVIAGHRINRGEGDSEDYWFIIISTIVLVCTIVFSCRFLALSAIGITVNSPSPIPASADPSKANQSASSSADISLPVPPSVPGNTEQQNSTCIINNNVAGFNGANVRSGPSLSHSILQTYANGTPIKIMDRSQVYEDGYYWVMIEVMAAGVRGWMVAGKIYC